MTAHLPRALRLLEDGFPRVQLVGGGSPQGTGGWSFRGDDGGGGGGGSGGDIAARLRRHLGPDKEVAAAMFRSEALTRAFLPGRAGGRARAEPQRSELRPGALRHGGVWSWLWS